MHLNYHSYYKKKKEEDRKRVSEDGHFFDWIIIVVFFADVKHSGLQETLTRYKVRTSNLIAKTSEILFELWASTYYIHITYTEVKIH